MSEDVCVYVEGGIVVVPHVGALHFHQSNQAILAAVEAARKAGSNRILFDFRRAELSNYYSYWVRHAEQAPELGLDTRYKLAFVGEFATLDVLSFLVLVTRNRGWQSQCFYGIDSALKWLRSQTAAEETDPHETAPR